VLSHGRWPHGTDWLLEVTAESYVPLLDALYDLAEEGASPRITVGLTPVLVEQLADESFKSEFSAYAKTRARAASENKREFQRLKDEPMIHLADFWHEYYSDILRSFTTRFKRSLVKAFAELQDVGHIEIMTSSATHGYSPLLSQDASLQAQVKQGVATYKRHFKRQPLGYWLPECAYRPGYRWSPPLQPKGRTIEPYCRKGVEEFLRESGLKYFIIESHLLHGGETRGVYIDRFGALQKLWKQYMEEEPALDAVKTPYAAYMLTPTKADDAPVCVFVRDHVTGSQVWSRWQGYPGDEWYLEFHKKHSPGGLRYWRVTSPDVDLGDKLVYEPARTEERVTSHVEHFVGTVREVLRRHLDQTGAPGVICAPYDTELYGHWWFEGVGWLKRVLKAMNNDPEIELTTCSDYLEKHPPTTEISLPEGSWGEGGFHYMWLN
jgi:1,4-alpha-glucan branching enzyme